VPISRYVPLTVRRRSKLSEFAWEVSLPLPEFLLLKKIASNGVLYMHVFIFVFETGAICKNKFFLDS